jgi:hypothetical protein
LQLLLLLLLPVRRGGVAVAVAGTCDSGRQLPIDRIIYM